MKQNNNTARLAKVLVTTLMLTMCISLVKSLTILVFLDTKLSQFYSLCLLSRVSTDIYEYVRIIFDKQTEQNTNAFKVMYQNLHYYMTDSFLNCTECDAVNTLQFATPPQHKTPSTLLL